MVGTSILRLIPADRHEEEQQILAKIRRGENVEHFETRRQTKDGRLIDVSVTASPIKDPGGAIIGVSKVARDITGSKRAEETLRQQAALFDQTYDAVIVWTWNGPITFWNRGAELLYGFSRAEAMGRISHELLQTRFPDGPDRLIPALEEKKRWEGELEHTTRDGRKITVETRMTCIYESDRAQVLEANRDITERKLAEIKIQQLNTELEQRVSERTAQLEAANKELEAFSYSVSHDLRAPLRGVDGFVRMLQEDCAGQLDAEGNRLLGVVRSEAKRMGHLIDDLLAFSRLGREQMKISTMDMSDMARAVFDELTRAVTGTAPRFELKTLPPANGDPSMVRQVFINLISNAIKFSRHQPVPVIEVGGQSAGGINTYYVKDNGVGFNEKYGHKLFGVFQRLHSEDEFEGTGVGLALVQRIIQRHGGKVRAESKPNQGATFYFTLPIAANNKGI